MVRYRVERQLYVARRASLQFMSSVIARVKIMAGLNIAEKRLPQDDAFRCASPGAASISAFRRFRRAVTTSES